MPKLLKYISVFILFGLLILVRLFENQLFYDPYLQFFKHDYLYLDNPRREVLKVIAFTSLRFLLNMLISLSILYIFFRDKGILKFSALIYVIAYLVLILLYTYFVVNPNQDDYYLFFNIRRFLIQPIILILLLPAFYYQKLKE